MTFPWFKNWRRRPVPPAVAELRDQHRRALRTLHRSHLGRTGATLPWYLVLGAPGAGKTRALLGSGLSFPLALDPRAAAEPAGGPCQWHFSGDGIFVEAPGGFLAEGEPSAVWLELLRLLRPRPMAGILVAVAVPELLEAEAPEALGRQLRRRLEEAGRTLRDRMPVYLLFTKADRLQGFQAFFGGADPAQDPWGAALPHDLPPGAVRARVAEELATLRQGLAAEADRLRGQGSAGACGPALATLPMAFRALEPALDRFLDGLLGLDPYHAQPLLRGFWFTSAGPDPAPVPLAARVAGFDLELPEPGAPAGPGGPRFLQGVFRQALLPDRDLAAKLAWPGYVGRLVAVTGAVLLLLAGLMAAFIISTLCNLRFLAALHEEVAAAAPLSAGPALEDRMQALMVLQLRLEQLEQERLQGRPWARRWGLDQSGELERILRARYFSGVSRVLLAPVKADLERSLGAGGPRPAPAPRPERLPQRRSPAPSRPAAPMVPLLRVAHRQPAAPAPLPAVRQSGLNERAAQQLYNTLKTYLMLNDRSRLEAAHLADQLPRCWRPYLEQNGLARGQLKVMAGRMVAFYVSQLHAADLPLIQNRPELVAAARGRLRASARLLSPADQLYLELKARAEAECEPLDGAAILQDRDLDLLATDRPVPASFTRAAYDQLFRTAFQEAGRNGRCGSDWVLAADRPGQDPERLRKELEARYKADYGQAWEQFLGGIRIQGFADPAGAAAALARLGDPQQSPLKRLLARAAQETAWDNPGEIEKSLQNVKQGVIARTGRLLGQSTPAPAKDRFGPLGLQFSSLAALAAPENPPIDGYLQLLQKLRTRLGALAQAPDPDAGAREYLQATLRGAGSELAEAQAFIDTSLLPRMDPRGRDQLRPILLKPLVQAFDALVPAAERDIERGWSQQVLGPWKSLAGRYPFADSEAEASLADIQRFLKPADGTLATFLDKHLGALLQPSGGRFAGRRWEGRGVAFSDSFLAAAAGLARAGAALQEPGSRFELQPVPAPGLREIVLEIDGQKLHYRNGPQTWTGFSWPGPGGAQGARLQVAGAGGAAAVAHSAPGRMGLLRLLDRARGDVAGAATILEWPVRAPGGEVGRIRMNYRLVSGQDPLRLSALRHHTLPAKATR